MTRRFRSLTLALIALPLAMTLLAAGPPDSPAPTALTLPSHAASPSPAAVPTPDPSVRMPSSPQPPFAAPARLTIPTWRQGQSWSIECDYPDGLGAGTPPWVSGHQRRSTVHPRFTFTVDRVADSGPLRLFSVQVRPGSQSQRTSADLVFAGQRLKDGNMASLFLMKGLYKVPVAMGTTATRRDYNEESKGPFPVINDVSGIPCDFPVLNQADLAGHDAKQDGIWKEYEAAEAMEGGVRSRSVRQTILFASDKMQFGERVKVAAPRAECVDVFMKLLHAAGNETVRLVFHPAYPWPVYGEGPKGRFWLLP